MSAALGKPRLGRGVQPCQLMCGSQTPAVHAVGPVKICEACWQLALAIAADAGPASQEQEMRRNAPRRHGRAGFAAPERTMRHLGAVQIGCRMADCSGVVELTTDGNGRLVESPCLECRIRRPAAAVPARVPPLQCVDCEAEIESGKRCPPCKRIEQRAASRRYRKREPRPLVCAHCGREIDHTGRRGRPVKYCKATCATAARARRRAA